MSGQDELFYRDDTTSVTRYWLTKDATSYAIRTLIRITFIERKSPPVTSVLLVFVSLAVVLFAVYRWFNSPLPQVLSLALLIFAALLFICAIWEAFLKPPLYLIKASFADGTEVRLVRSSQQQAMKLREAINHAMNYHRYYASMFDEIASEQIPELEVYDSVDELNRRKEQRRTRFRGLAALLYGSSK